MLPFFLEKRKRNKELDQNGFYIGAVHNEDGLKRFLICLLRGLMVFLACYSVTVGLVEAFDLTYNHIFVSGALLAISIFASLLYINKPVFYVGYFLLLFGFTYALGYYYFYANSGFQAIINTIYEVYSDHFHLLSLREAQEYITDRYVTVSVAMVFIGALLAILLNVTISGYMNLLETILITFPFLEIAFYIGKRPPLYCIVMLLACYICVGIQQAGKYSKMQVKGKHTPEYLRFRRKKETTYVYQSTARGTLQTLLFSLILSVITGFGFYTSYYSEVPIQPSNAIKDQADNYIKIFVQSGFTGLFDRYESTGGLNQGRLGGVSEIRPDFETDLTVTFAPYSYDTVYLKSYTGSYYTNNQWSPHTYLSTYPEAIQMVPEEFEATLASSTMSVDNVVYMDENTIQMYDAMYYPKTDAIAKMEIINLDSYGSQHLPYYTSEIPPSTDGSTTMVTYCPYLGDYDENPAAYDLPLYYDLYVNEFCLQIPDDLRPVLEEYCAEQNFPGIVTSEFTDAPSNPEDINAYRLDVAQSVYEHFVADFDYTMSPGSTPYRQDFVAYFLTTQKRGVCAHFAASATMILRSMGVPARYVEGYCIPLSVMSNGQAVNTNYDDWYQGPSQVTEHGVLTVNVTDAQAHAWVEIYLEGYGFVPFEMTPPDFADESNINLDFGNIFDNLFNFNLPIEELPESSSQNTNEINTNNFPRFTGNFANIAAPVLIMVGSIAGVGILLFLIKYLYRRYRIRKLMQNKQYAELMYMDYISLCRKVKSRMALPNPNPLPDELCEHIKELLSWMPLSDRDAEDLEQMFLLLEKSLYAPGGITTEEYDYFQTTLGKLYKLLKQKKKS